MILEILVPNPIYNTSSIRFSPIFLVGCSIATLGGFIRYKCYRELGRLFTYEVTIQQNHQLVTTGPYAYVRHPSYASVIASWAGMAVCLASPGSWLKECGVLKTLAGKTAAWLYVGYGVWGTVTAVARTSLEDRLMKEQFGGEWNKWAQNVPYRLIPRVVLSKLFANAPSRTGMHEEHWEGEITCDRTQGEEMLSQCYRQGIVGARECVLDIIDPVRT
ncbi:predicted protein [Postia placenta Mad-698-R]|uniref:Protein-S-isoprenylcysteine O-methyltransferase n=1 Tax=Postia placenta MAD-698-R-SB12 TaxID=670580 RepID=A0A1X6MKM8_9APHY|nr:hypothetical protein POSPLADRAFT_1158514 [Postia placenta MAD-698-R-SB12]EED81358.1 predicted protein [Postia placenta Mad-698-R]OSX56839.1 hypothetical protein POSPLADRAFT_1158514 [Postia placenta MAD-698-R-SB12]